MLLLVDDNDEFRGAAAEALEAAGLQVVQAADAEEAAAIFQEEEITLLVTDLRLPSAQPSPLTSEGEELAKACLARNPQLPIIVVSSHADADLPTRLGSARVEILAKPFPLEKLARRSIALLAGEPAESTGALPAAVIKKREESTGHLRARREKQSSRKWLVLAGTAATLALLAAGAGYLVAVGRKAPPPAVPAPVEIKAEQKIEPLAPVGPIGDPPQELAWQPISGSRLYKVALSGVDEEILFRGETPQSHIALPPDLGRELRPALAYYWSVEAVGEGGEKLAAASKVRFRFVPPGRSAAGG